MPPTDSGGDVPAQQRDELLTRHISGFRPAVTGTLCDVCNRGLSEGDTVFVRAIWYGTDAVGPDGGDLPAWSLSATYCDDCGSDHDPDDFRPDGRLVRCELGPLIANGEGAPLYNPEVQ